MAAQRSAGVWLTDAPAGYVGIVIYDRCGHLQMRLEIAEAHYNDSIVEPLKEWSRQNERVRLIG
jgi:hypothetical protein